MSELWTLATDGVEQTLQDWGVTLDGFECYRVNKGKSTVTLRTTENFDPATVQWTHYKRATIYRGVASVAGVITPGSGTVFFKGYFDDPRMTAAPDAQSITYQLHNVWWLFEQNQFRQFRNQFTKFSLTNKRILSATVSAKGNNYTVGDVLTVAGAGPSPATFKVVATGPNGEVILVWATNGGGNYTVTPGPTVNPTGGTGGGLSLTLTFQAAPETKQVVTSELFLGEDLHAAQGYTELWPNGNGDQIGEVIDWVNGLDWAGQGMVGPICQKGVIDPHTHMPVTRVNSLFAAEAITNVLRWDPDAIVVIDDATEPPTFHVRKLGKWDYTTTPPTFIDYTNLPEVAINITASQERQIVVQSQLSKKWNGVIIYYLSVNQIDNGIYPVTVPDIFPPGVNDKTPFVLSQTIELSGSKVTHQVVNVNVNTSSPFGLLFGTAAQQLAWWAGHDKTLADPNIDPLSGSVSGPPTIVDNNNVPINTAVFNQELLDSSIPTWAGSAVRAHVSQIVSYKRYKEPAFKTLDVAKNNQRVVKTIVLTNSPGGLYQTIGSISTAEPIPQNVAESAYRTLAAQQWAGEITFLSNPMRSNIPVLANGNDTDGNPSQIVTNGAISLGVRIALIGPTRKFTNLMVQSIRQVPSRGETTVQFGPGPLLDIDTWIEFARASRSRITWDLPSGRGDGGTSNSGSNSIDTSGTVSTNDTAHGAGGHGFDSVIGPRTL